MQIPSFRSFILNVPAVIHECSLMFAVIMKFLEIKSRDDVLLPLVWEKQIKIDSAPRICIKYIELHGEIDDAQYAYYSNFLKK